MLFNLFWVSCIYGFSDENRYDFSIISINQWFSFIFCLGIKELQQDFKKMLRNINADVALRVGDQEFRANRHILTSHSPVFLALLTPDIHLIHIDADPRIFAVFLNYLHTENVENITPENSSELYMMADKYEVNSLKIICLNYMLENISVDNFCDVLSVAVLFVEEDLKEACFEFFSRRSREIILTYKWQKFLRENLVTGNELLIRQLIR